MKSPIVTFEILFLVIYHNVYDVTAVQSINILFANEERNTVADKAFDVVLNYLRRKSDVGVQVENQYKVSANGSDARTFLENLCKEYNNSIAAQKPPHLIVDTTLSGVPSETVKSFVEALALPTISASYGQEGDLRQWRNLSPEEEKYLIQIMPPADLIPEVIRSIVVEQNITNAGVLFDDSFVMDHKYKSLLQNIPTRHVIVEVQDVKTLKTQLQDLRGLDIFNFFILGRPSTITNVLDAAAASNYYTRQFAWFTISLENEAVKCACANATVVSLNPEPDVNAKERLAMLKSTYSLTTEPEISAAFYFDFFLRSFLAVKSMLDANQWPADMKYITCDDYREDSPPTRANLDLQKALSDVTLEPAYGKIEVESNGHSQMQFIMRLQKVNVLNNVAVSSEPLGLWKASLDSPLQMKKSQGMANLTAITFYRIVTVVQKPFVMPDGVDDKGKTKYKGYCIDLINEIQALSYFNYEIYEVADGKFGNMDENGNWNGMIKDLMEKKADIALGSLAVMAERENVVDFTVPYYDLVGVTILMKKPKAPTSLFKFLTVLENDVWLCILAAYFFTSFLMWVFDRWSPYSYQNNREKYKDDEEKREFNLKECLWFCMTSLTPQGGGEAPKNLSGRLVAATWWLFGFIIIASYTANLAAFLTVSRLDTPVESLDDLSKQYKILYAPLQDSSAQTYFKRMSDIEHKFYEIWKDMSLNDSLSNVERAKLAVWDYPVSDKYTKIWQAMKEAGFPLTLEDALVRVRDSKSSSEGFAFLGDATDIRYQVLTNCDLQMVGEEFSRKPYAIATQQGSPLKDQFNNAILQLLNKRKLEKLKEQWWNQNPDRKTDCEKQDDQSDGISIQNIGGVFIVIFVGIGLACITLAFEYWWYKYKHHPQVIDVGAQPVTMGTAPSKLDAGLNLRGFRPRNPYPEQHFRRPPVQMTGVTNPW